MVKEQRYVAGQIGDNRCAMGHTFYYLRRETSVGKARRFTQKNTKICRCQITPNFILAKSTDYLHGTR